MLLSYLKQSCVITESSHLTSSSSPTFLDLFRQTRTPVPEVYDRVRFQVLQNRKVNRAKLNLSYRSVRTAYHTEEGGESVLYVQIRQYYFTGRGRIQTRAFLSLTQNLRPTPLPREQQIENSKVIVTNSKHYYISTHRNQLTYPVYTELCEPWSTTFMGKWSTENSKADRHKHKLTALLHFHAPKPTTVPYLYRTVRAMYYTSTFQNQLVYLICTELCEPWSTHLGKWSTENSKTDRRKHKLTVVLHFHAPKPTNVPYLYRTVRAMVYNLHGKADRHKHKLTALLHFHAPKPTTVPYLYRTVRAMYYTSTFQNQLVYLICTELCEPWSTHLGKWSTENSKTDRRKHKLTVVLHFHAPKPTNVPYLYRIVRAMVYTLHGRKHKLTVVLHFHAPKPTTVPYLYRTVRAMVYTLHGVVKLIDANTNSRHYYTSTLQNQLLYLICTELCEPWSTRFMGKWSTENSKADRRKHKLTALHFHAPKPTTVPYLYRTVRAMVYTLHG
ncbi:hypothetical protein J6590_047696 [Homalodisca vitripennis]|nr:hypothetical protein J6590_047696 [Homalodisca vitripennis]